MNTTSALEISKEVQASGKSVRLVAQLKKVTHAVVRSIKENSIRLGEGSARTASGYQLGEPVRHGQFGRGRVVAHWPDGTLLVRFEDMAKSRLVWPSFLDRVNERKS